MSSDSQEFDRLTERAAAGDRAAVDQLLEALLPDLRAFVRLRMGKLIRSQETDSDIVQSVCREVLTHSSRFEHAGEAAFRRWLFTTTLRKLSNRRDYLLAEKRDALRSEPDEAGLRDAYARIASPSRHASVREELERMEEAMAQLSEGDRTLVVLSRIVGLSRAELAEETGLSEGAVRMRLHRALAKLALMMETEDDRREG